MMTQNQAANKWCPLVRVGGSNKTDSGFETSGAHCMGSNCALWVWDRISENNVSDPSEGHCGLIK